MVGCRLSGSRCAEILELRAVDQLGRDDDDPGTRARGERRGSRAAQQQCTLADNRTRPDLADVLAVDLRDEHAVEDEVELIAGLALLDEDLADVQLAPGEIGVAAHELARELPFERALRRRDERLGLLVAPRRVLAVRLAIPGLEVDRPGLGGEVPVLVIDPVARERARSHDLVLGGPSVRIVSASVVHAVAEWMPSVGRS